PAGHPCAVAFSILARAVLLAKWAKLPRQQVARDGVRRGLVVVVGQQLFVRALHASVEHSDADRLVAGGPPPGVRHIHAVVIPLEDPFGVGLAKEGRQVVPRVGRAIGARVAKLRVVLPSHAGGASGIRAWNASAELVYPSPRDAWVGLDSSCE